jgi:chromosome partitioning protein
MRTIAVINQKGGVGKTTTAVNICAALAEGGRRVLLIDVDPQAHATLHLGIELQADAPSIYSVLCDDTALADAVMEVEQNLWIVGSHIDLAAAELEMVNVQGRDLVLRNKLSKLEPTYDYVVIDCPPSLGILTINALAAVDEVILPMQPHFLALHGLSKLLQTIHMIAKRLNPSLALAGVVFCMYESGTRLAAEVSGDVEQFFEQSRGQQVPWSDARVFQSRIRRNVRLAEAPSFGRSIFNYAPECNGAVDYRSLVSELESRASDNKQRAA